MIFICTPCTVKICYHSVLTFIIPSICHTNLAQSTKLLWWVPLCHYPAVKSYFLRAKLTFTAPSGVRFNFFVTVNEIIIFIQINDCNNHFSDDTTTMDSAIYLMIYNWIHDFYVFDYIDLYFFIAMEYMIPLLWLLQFGSSKLLFRISITLVMWRIRTEKEKLYKRCSLNMKGKCKTANYIF